jgi:predicted RNase H-like HicB family nuclease
MNAQTYTFTAVVNKQGEQYHAFCPEVITDAKGETIDEAIANLKTATREYIEKEGLPGFTKPWLIVAGIEVKPKGGQKHLFDVIAHQEDGEYVVFCPEVGTADQGQTLEFALRMLKEGTKLYLENASLPNYSKPQLIDFSVEAHERELERAA